MKVFYESRLAKWLLWQGYSTITLGCLVFTKKSRDETQLWTLNHEDIHVWQWKELTILSAILWMLGFLFWNMPFAGIFIVPFVFYIWYALEWFIRLAILCANSKDDDSLLSIAYRSISFEQEAYGNADNVDYLASRKVFGFIKYYFTKK